MYREFVEELIGEGTLVPQYLPTSTESELSPSLISRYDPEQLVVFSISNVPWNVSSTALFLPGTLMVQK